MKRRNFISAAGITAAASTYVSANSSIIKAVQAENRAIIEWRTYQMKWGKNTSMFMKYLSDMLKPALLSAGSSSVVIYKEKSVETPTNIHVQITHPDMGAYQNSLLALESSDFRMTTKEYDAQESSPYDRLSTSLLHAFTGMPKLRDPIKDAQLYELRIYEGYNEDAVRRKIAMFNDEEIDLFLDLQLQPIFFGNMIAGPYMPSLVYMLNFRDEAHRAEAWKEFLDDPRWKKMVADPKYANTVSNIRNILLEVI